LNQLIEEIEREIESVVNEDKALKARLEYILSIKGVGLMTVVCIVSETNGFAAISSIKQLTSYAGLDIKLKESGKWKGKSKISKKGNKHIRKSLYFPAFSLIEHDPATKEKYCRLKEKKGIPMVAAVAQQRKLLGLIYTLWKKQEMFSAVA
jgi:transposase